MKLENILLEGYTRLGLGAIRYFELTPTAQMQFIIATNGYGKSSLTDRLSPLPADKEHFTANGKEIKNFTRNGNKYKLVADFGKDHPYEFWRNDVNLNDGGTITVQRELVKHHFKYDNHLHKFVQGQRTFSEMSVSERKDLFSVMLEANYEYALSVFGKAKKLHRDLIGSRDTQKKRLVLETARIISKEDHKVMQDQVAELYKVIEEMLELRNPDVKNQQAMENHFGTLIDKAKDTHKRLGVIFKRVRRGDKGTMDELRLRLQGTRDVIVQCNALSEHYQKDFEQINEIARAYEAAKVDSISGIDKSIRENEERIEQARKSFIIGIDDDANPDVVIQSCEAAARGWLAIVDSLHDNEEVGYNRESYEKANAELSRITNEMRLANERIARAKQIIEHQNHHAKQEDIECPKCKHNFKVGFDPRLVEELKAQVTENETALDNLDKARLVQIELIDKMRKYFEAYRSAVNIFKTLPCLQKLTDYLLSSKMIANRPLHVSGIIENYRIEAGNYKVVIGALKDIEAARVLMDKTMNDRSDAGDVFTRRTQVEAKTAEVAQKQMAARQEEASLLQSIRYLELMEQLRNELRNLDTDIDAHKAAMLENYRREAFNKMLRELQSDLANKEQALRTADRQMAVIEHITKEIELFTEQIKDVDVIVKELSPTEGLIAEGVFSFMKRFIGTVNNNLRKVWSYPMSVKPCASERGDNIVLNYKFPLVVNNDTKPRKDIAEGSEGMVEAIDLAFRIAGMKALGMEDFPLILDEYGRTFDHKHKTATVHMVLNLLETSSFSNIFMISHDIAQYSSIGVSETCVLNSDNIVLPPNCVYNKHVVIK